MRRASFVNRLLPTTVTEIINLSVRLTRFECFIGINVRRKTDKTAFRHCLLWSPDIMLLDYYKLLKIVVICRQFFFSLQCMLPYRKNDPSKTDAKKDLRKTIRCSCSVTTVIGKHLDE